MTALVRSISALLGGVGLLLLGNGLLGTLLGIGLADMEVGATVSGLVMAAYFAGLILGALKVSTIIVGVGHIRTFAALASTYSAASLAHAFLFDPLAWAGLRLVEGFCMAGLYMCVESWLNERATTETRGLVLSVYMVTVYLAQGMAQFLLMAGDTTGFVLFALVSILTSLAVLPIGLTRMPSPSLPDISSFGLRRLARISPTAVAASMGSGLVMGAFYSLGPLFARQSGLDLSQVAAFMSAVIIGGLLLQVPLGRLSDHMDRRLILIGVCLFLGLSALGLAFGGITGLFAEESLGFPGFLVASVLFGAAATMVYPLSLALANDRIEAWEMVGVSGGLLLTNSLGSMVGPLVAAGVMEGMGPSGLFVFCGITGVLLALYTLRRVGLRDAAPDDHKMPFQVVLRTTPVAGEMDPRAEADDGQYSFDFEPKASDTDAQDPDAEDGTDR